MTVKELVERLKDMDTGTDKKVGFWDSCGGWSIVSNIIEHKDRLEII